MVPVHFSPNEAQEHATGEKKVVSLPGSRLKDTSSVALNPVIKFTTLFGLLAVELAVSLTTQKGGSFSHLLAAAFFVVSFVFVYRSFFGMRIKGSAA